MSWLKVSKAKNCFIREDRNFFYLADTVWSVFTTATLEEWKEYLDYRKLQGFNALQINILPQWDASKPDLGIYPFIIDQEGRFCFDRMNPEYFKRAEQMLKMAVDRGFIPVLVILWSNYVKGTLHSDKTPENLMPREMVEGYVRYAVESFSRFEPIYILGGDTDFPDEETVEFYRFLAGMIRSLSPEALITLHTQPHVMIPDSLARDKLIDFYLYQAGHRKEEQANNLGHAQQYYHKPVKMPIVNGEPCYEGIGHGFEYGRYGTFDVRKAVWQSLLSGAKAGITYGAHGIWGWHTKDKVYGQTFEFGDKPFDWRTALRFKGAWEAGFAKWIFETYTLFDVEPQNKILNPTKEIRMSASSCLKKIIIYAPYNTDIKVDMLLEGYDWTYVNLAEKLFGKPTIKLLDGYSTIQMSEFNADALLIGMK